MAEGNVVLDTSAVISFLCDENGADRVESYLLKAKKGSLIVYLSFATIAEVFSSAVKKEVSRPIFDGTGVQRPWDWLNVTEDAVG